MKTTRSMPSFNGVAASSTATLNLPIGLTYHSLLITRGGTFTMAHITEIRLKANGRQIGTITGSDLDSINQYEGKAAAGATFRLDFDRFNLKTRAGNELTAIGTGYKQVLDVNASDYNPTPITNLQLEIDIGAATSPTLSAKAIQSGPKPMGQIIKRRKFVYSPSAAGDFEISDLPKGDLIDKIMIKAAADNLDELKLDRDNFRVFDRTEAENELIQTDGVRVPQANWFMLDPSEIGNGAEAIISAVQDFRLICTMSAADTLTIYVDYIGGLTGN